MKKITILCLHLGYGGIEKAVTSLANMLICNYEIEIISTYQLQEKPAFEIDNRVTIKYLLNTKPNKKQFLEKIQSFQFIKAFKEGIQSLKILYFKKKRMIEAIQNCHSDIIISTRDIHNKWLGKYGNITSTKIAWEHNHPHGNNHYSKKIINSVKNIDYLVLVSKSLKRYYTELVNPNCKCIYIPNYLEEIPTNISELKSKNLVSVGRLEKEKGFLDLIQVIKQATIKDPTIHLDLIGDGSQKEKIKQSIQNENLQNHITLHGYLNTKQIFQIHQNASLYLMTSHTESFGIVLLEAMINGLPCIAFDSAEGAQELLTNSADGYLIENRDIHKMSEKILELLQNEEKRKQMGKQARMKAMKYTKEAVKTEWRRLIDETEKN